MLKKVDKYLIKSFTGPFVVAFFIAIFVLVMQFLWSFIDEITGKGISTFDILELIFYRSLSLFPLALPIGVLLAAVMVFGSLAERYELSSLKSAGVSLVRIMAPVGIYALLIACFSLYCSDTLIPLSNLKFFSRLHDIRNQKPALSLEEGVFNDDFKGFTIRIGKKAKDNRRIFDILIYDQSTSSRRQFNMITAKSGEMYMSDDLKYFVMHLEDGHQYREVERTGSGQKLPFARTNFKEWTKYFDLGEFEMGKTPEEYFKSHHQMKSVGQLLTVIDTIDQDYDRTLMRGLYDFTGVTNNRRETVVVGDAFIADSLKRKAYQDSMAAIVSSAANSQANEAITEKPALIKDRPVRAIASKAPVVRTLDTLPSDANWDAIFASFSDRSQEQYITQAVSKVNNLINDKKRLKTKLEIIEARKADHIYELHFKFALSFIIVIFLFIGAPMGAIVRKGGYGYPLLVAIIFFTVFIVLTLLFDKLVETGSMTPILGAWAACLIMLPFATFLTFKALNDSKMLDTTKISKAIAKLFKQNDEVSA